MGLGFRVEGLGLRAWGLETPLSAGFHRQPAVFVAASLMALK